MTFLFEWIDYYYNIFHEEKTYNTYKKQLNSLKDCDIKVLTGVLGKMWVVEDI